MSDENPDSFRREPCELLPGSVHVSSDIRALYSDALLKQLNRPMPMNDENPDCFVLASDLGVARLVAHEEATARSCRVHPAVRPDGVVTLDRGELESITGAAVTGRPLVLVVEDAYLKVDELQTRAPGFRFEAVSGHVTR